MANSLRSTTQARSVLAIIAVLLAPIGSAQQPEAQTNAPASMEKETPSQGKQLILQSAVGLDELSADKVVKHIARSMKDDERYARALMAQQCRELRKTALPADQFASRLAAADQAAIAHRDGYDTRLFSLTVLAIPRCAK